MSERVDLQRARENAEAALAEDWTYRHHGLGYELSQKLARHVLALADEVERLREPGSVVLNAEDLKKLRFVLRNQWANYDARKKALVILDRGRE